MGDGESRGQTAVGGGFLLLFSILVLVGAVTRPPWLDELTTLYFLDEPNHLLARYRGDPHPVGCYLLLVSARLISGSVAWLGVYGLVVIPAVMTAICHQVVPGRRWWHRVLTIAPAFAGCGIVLRHGTDLRMYGGLTLAALVFAVAMSEADRDTGPSARWPVATAVTLLAVLHVWGAVLAGAYTGALLARTALRVRDLVRPGIVATVAVLCACWPSLLQHPEPTGALPMFDLDLYLRWWFLGGSRWRSRWRRPSSPSGRGRGWRATGRRPGGSTLPPSRRS